MRTKVYEIPDKVLIEWDSDANVMIANWFTYAVSLAEYKEAIFNKGLNMVKIHKAITTMQLQPNRSAKTDAVMYMYQAKLGVIGGVKLYKKMPVGIYRQLPAMVKLLLPMLTH